MPMDIKANLTYFKIRANFNYYAIEVKKRFRLNFQRSFSIY